MPSSTAPSFLHLLRLPCILYEHEVIHFTAPQPCHVSQVINDALRRHLLKRSSTPSTLIRKRTFSITIITQVLLHGSSYRPPHPPRLWVVSCRGMPPNDTRTDTTTVRQSTRLPSDTLPTRTTTQPPQGGDRTRISYEGHLYLTIAYLSACT